MFRVATVCTTGHVHHRAWAHEFHTMILWSTQRLPARANPSKVPSKCGIDISSIENLLSQQRAPKWPARASGNRACAVEQWAAASPSQCPGLSLLLPSQLHDDAHPGRQPMAAQVVETLSPMWETRSEFWAGWCGHLGSESVDESSLSPSSASQTKKT